MSPELTQWRTRVFAATWLSYAGLYFCRKPFYIAKATMGDELGWSAETLGLIGSVYLIAYTVGQFVAGWSGNRWGPRLVLLTGMLVTAAVNVAFGMTNSVATFSVLMALNGLAQATGWSNNVGTMANWFQRKELGTIMGAWATNFQVGGFAASTAAAFVLGQYGWQSSYFFGASVMLVVWVVFFFNQANHPRDVDLALPIDEADEAIEADDEGWTRDIIINVAIMGVFYFFVKFIRYALWSWAPYLLTKFYGQAADDAGYLSTAFDLAGIAGVVVLGWASDRFFEGRRAKLSFVFICGMAISCCLLYFLGAVHVIVFTLCLALIGFTLYGPDAIMTSAGAIDVGSAQRAVLAAGIINGMGSMGSVLQELALGVLLERAGVGAVFATLLASSVLAALCLGLLLIRNQQGHADM